jgi:hypothetical protein
MPDFLGQKTEGKKSNTMLAMLLRMFADFISGDSDDDSEQDGTVPPATEAFREPSVRTRPDFFPRP